MIFRRDSRFDELTGRQLDLFAEDEIDLLSEAEEAEQAWSRAGKDEAEEAYGDYQLVVDAIADILLDIRESYAATLDDAVADDYRNAFNRAARKRYRRYTSLLADLDES